MGLRTSEGGTQVGVGTTPLLEREPELAVLARAVAEARSGTARLVLIEGPAGIGKSRLVTEARRRASDAGLRVLSARGGELERDFPFGVVRQLFEARLADPQVSARALAGSAAQAASVLGLEDAAPVEGHGPGEGTFAALHALYWLTINLSAEQPLLLAIDDLHWCDRGSLRYLAYLVRRLEDLPVVVVGSLRPSEPGSDQALLAELTSDPQADVLLPGPLSEAAVHAVAQDRLGDLVEREFSSACHASTQGNPLLLNELLKALVAEGVAPVAGNVRIVAELGPRAASRAVLLRLARLSPAAVATARAIAVLGEGADVGVIASLAELDGEVVADATRELVRSEMLRPDPPLAFVHPLVQAAVYRDLAPGERELLHERAARLLRGLAAPAEQIAAHLVAMSARGESWVVETLREAASAALAKGASESAISSLARALDEPLPAGVRGELLLELGAAEVLTSLPMAAAHLREAYETLADPTARGYAAEGLARTLVFMGLPAESAEIARLAARVLPDELFDLRDRLEAMELLAVFFGAPIEDRRERMRAYRDLDPTRGIGARMLAAVSAWEWTESAGPASAVCALSRAALGAGVLVDEDSALMTIVATIPLALADQEDTIGVWDAVRADAHKRGSVFAISGAQLWGGYTQVLRGDLAEAESELRASIETLELWGVPTQLVWPTAFLAEVLLERGAPEEARRWLETAGEIPDGSDQVLILDRAWVAWLLADGRPEEALERAQGFEQRAEWRQHPRYLPWRSLQAEALDRLGRRDEALALAAEDVEVARGWGSPGTVGRSLRILGTIEREDGIAHLGEACALLEGVPARLEQAKALAALGAALRRGRKPTEAREPLRRALELAEICSAGPLADIVRAEIYATGARPRTTALKGVGALTASERRVADLAAEGLSNRDIAQALYVTPKTVEVHLTNAYRKLEIVGRRELPRALADAG